MTVLSASGLYKSFRRRPVVRDVSLQLSAGEVVGLLGPNGAGKSTTFNMMAGLITPDGGQIRLGDQPLEREPLHVRARLGLGYLPQEPTVFRGLTVQDNLLAVLELLPLTRAERHRRAQELLEAYNLTAVATSKGSELSGGERRRLEMARALVPEPAVLLLDEPFAGIDPIAVAEIHGFIERLRDSGIGILLTDHNVRETLRICDRAYLIAEGQIMLQGAPEEIVADERARKTYLGESFQL